MNLPELLQTRELTLAEGSLYELLRRSPGPDKGGPDKGGPDKGTHAFVSASLDPHR
jgi:hypothetical protein